MSETLLYIQDVFSHLQQMRGTGMAESNVLSYNIPVPVQKHSQVFIDISLRKIVRKFLKIQYRLRNLQAIGVDSTVRVLSQTEFLCKKRTDAKPSAIQACLVMAEVRRRKTTLNSLCESRHGLNGLV